MSTLYLFVAPPATRKTTFIRKFFAPGEAEQFAELDVNFYPVLPRLDAGYDCVTATTPARLAEQKEREEWEQILQRHQVVVFKVELLGNTTAYPK